MSRNILLLTQNFPPDIGAPSFRMEAFARELASRGYQVNVLTAYPNRYRELNVKTYDDFGAFQQQRKLRTMYSMPRRKRMDV